ncbi:hypothetical protein [Nocardia sp. NPDC057668]|uniref:hypothetical protein n=1 Tax=Nocardia sp. NPDC057668 TaxID=3346202 RepID=UPI003672985A
MDTMRWLHEEGLIRLAAVGDRLHDPISAYTIAIADGTVTAHPASGNGLGANPITMAADDLPPPAGTRKRLLIAGITSNESMLIINLAATHTISIIGENERAVARSWILQLLLDPDCTVTTNNEALTVPTEPRCRLAFIPGAGTAVFTADDRRPPPTTVTLGSTETLPDRLEISTGGSGGMYMSARYWPLRTIHRIRDQSWTALSAKITSESPLSTPATHSPNLDRATSAHTVGSSRD